jgi:hypothetical protein
MNPQTHSELHATLPGETGIELSHGLNHPQASRHGPLGVIFMGAGVAEIDQQTIAEVLGDMPLIAGGHFGAGGLIGLHHLAPVFRVKLTGEHGGVHQIAEQHCELTAFGVGGGRCGPWGCSRRRQVCWPGEVLVPRYGGRSERCGRISVTGPHDTLVVLAERVWVGIAQFGEEIGQGLRIKLKLPLQGAIGHAAPLAQQRQRLIDDRDKVHPVSSLLGVWLRAHGRAHHTISDRESVERSAGVGEPLELHSPQMVGRPVKHEKEWDDQTLDSRENVRSLPG